MAKQAATAMTFAEAGDQYVRVATNVEETPTEGGGRITLEPRGKVIQSCNSVEERDQHPR